MDSDDLFDSDNTYSPEIDVNTQICQLNVYEFANLVNEVIVNNKIRDATTVFYKVFHNLFKNSINTKRFHEEYSALSQLSICVKRLLQANKFNSVIFATNICRDFVEIPLDVIWWLKKNDIMCMAEFRKLIQHINIPADLMAIIRRNEDNEVFTSSDIVQDILVELMSGCHRPNAGVYNLHISTVWSAYCMEGMNQLIDHIFKSILHETSDAYVNFLPLITKSRNYLPSIVLKLFLKGLLNKFVTCNIELFDVDSSITYQELWCSKRIQHNLKIVYGEIFSEFCNMYDIVDIIEENELEINWKYTLAAVGVCVSRCTTGLTDAKDIALNYFNTSLKGGKILPFIKGLLFIRQACLEDDILSYKTWYAGTFGNQNNYKATRHIPFFKFFLRSLTKIIPREPKIFLKVHIDQVMFVPVTCNLIMHNYKNLCRARLAELKKSPSITIQDLEVVVLHIIEETFQNNKISRILIDVITNQYTDFCDNVVPILFREDPICMMVKQLLITEKYLTEDLQSFNVPIENENFDDNDFVL